VIVVPAMCGLGAPWWQPDALATIDGISLSTEPAHVVRATIDGLAAQVAVLARAAGFDLGRPLTRLQVDGGLTHSRLLMQTQSDLLQIPVEVASSPDATAIGVGALARLGAGEGKSLYDVVQPMAAPIRFEPAITADEAADRLGRFEDAVARLPGKSRQPTL
jgi:glycerol kinase